MMSGKPLTTHTLLLLLVLVLLVGSGCSSTRPVGEQIDDAAITAKVKSKLTVDPMVNPFRIDVDTERGVVRLSGSVDDQQTREEAERLARGTGGVTDVINELRVDPSSFDESLRDGAILAKVKSKLSADPEINPFNIDVDVDEGIVTLSGTVAKEAARAEAEKLALSTKGVQKVVNRIKVE